MMKQKLIWLAIVGILLCSTLVWAAPPLNLSLTTISKNPDGTVLHIVKNYLRDGNKSRIEYLSATGAVNAVSIFRKDRGLIWGVEPETKTYTEKKMVPGDWGHALFEVFPDPSLTLEKTGATKYLGFDCDSYTVVLKTLSISYVIVRDLNVIVKSELIQNNKIMQFDEATELKLEPPAAALFEIPAGYKYRKIIE